jgi:hypothetical protein
MNFLTHRDMRNERAEPDGMSGAAETAQVAGKVGRNDPCPLRQRQEIQTLLRALFTTFIAMRPLQTHVAAIKRP